MKRLEMKENKRGNNKNNRQKRTEMEK
jgi:hypothetical protein